MKIAILSVTKKGQLLSEYLRSILIKDSLIIKTDLYHKNVKSTINSIFNDYDAIIGIMSTGILILSIANNIKSKSLDPAVLSIDEKGKFVISLLSGHLGGANNLTLKISKIINATPVITTATDVNNKLAVDTLANKFYWRINNIKDIKIFNSAILNEEEIQLFVNLKQKKYLKNFLKNNNEIKLIVNNNDNNEIIAKYGNNQMRIISQKMVIGIGAKKNISKEKVMYAVKNACNQLNININRIDSLATADIKQNEKGIIQTSKELNLPLNIIKILDIKNFKCDDCTKSKFVEKTIGAYGVCEPSALLTIGNNAKLIYKKTAFNGVTIAIAISQN